MAMKLSFSKLLQFDQHCDCNNSSFFPVWVPTDVDLKNKVFVNFFNGKGNNSSFVSCLDILCMGKKKHLKPVNALFLFFGVMPSGQLFGHATPEFISEHFGIKVLVQFSCASLSS